jgi:hypothetical protein
MVIAVNVVIMIVMFIVVRVIVKFVKIIEIKKYILNLLNNNFSNREWVDDVVKAILSIA